MDTKKHSQVPIKNITMPMSMSMPNSMSKTKVMTMPMDNDMPIAIHSKVPMEKIKKMNNILFFNNPPPVVVNSIVKDIPSKNENKEENSLFGFFY